MRSACSLVLGLTAFLGATPLVAQATGSMTPACRYAQQALQDAMAKTPPGGDRQAQTRDLVPFMATRDLACNGDLARTPYSTPSGVTVTPVPSAPLGAAPSAGVANGSDAGAVRANIQAGVLPDSATVRQMIGQHATDEHIPISPTQLDSATGQAMAQMRATVAPPASPAAATPSTASVPGGRPVAPTPASHAAPIAPLAAFVPTDELPASTCGYGALSTLKGLNYAFNVERSIPTRFIILERLRDTQADLATMCPSLSAPNYPRPLRPGERSGEAVRRADLR